MPCATCRWFDADYYLADPEDPPEERIGSCEWPADKLPYSLRYGNRERTAVTPVDGLGCAQFEEHR